MSPEDENEFEKKCMQGKYEHGKWKVGGACNWFSAMTHVRVLRLYLEYVNHSYLYIDFRPPFLLPPCRSKSVVNINLDTELNYSKPLSNADFLIHPKINANN
jgi:hypothetical protein